MTVNLVRHWSYAQLGVILFDSHYVESIIMLASDTIFKPLYCAVPSFDPFSILGTWSEHDNVFVGGTGALWDTFDWACITYPELQLFLALLFDTLNAGASTVANVGLNSSIWGVGLQAHPNLLLDHVELILVEAASTSHWASSYGSAFTPALLSGSAQASPSFTMFLFTKLIVVASLMALFFMLTCTFTGLGGKSEWSADVEHVVSGLSVEVEKELFSVDDALHLLILLCVLLSGYFGALSFGALFQHYEVSVFLAILPLLFVSLVGIPLNLIFDFGLFFLTYLRGASSSKLILFELALDYIGVAAFFIRLSVQFVRLLIMFVIYFMMHEGVMTYQITNNFILFSGNGYSNVFHSLWSKTGLSYFLFTSVPMHMGY